MLHLWSSILGFALLLSVSSFAVADESQDEDHPPKGMVKVEQSDLVKAPAPSHDFIMRPYRERRGKWGAIFGISYNSYQPSNFVSSLLNSNFGDVYGAPQTPLLEAQLIVKRNFSLGSIGVEAAFGYYDNNSSADVSSELQISQYRLGIILILDTLTETPYFAPYGSVGAYMVSANESTTDNSNAITSIAPYVTLGVQCSLNWLDTLAARKAYQSGGIENTYLFAEVRMYFAGSNADGDFSNNFSPGGGLRVEF
jgi:hypothetical protein